MSPKSGDEKPVIEIVIQAPPFTNPSNVNVVSDNSNVVMKSSSYENYFISTILANFHAGYYRISLSMCAQVLLWKTLIRFTKQNHHNHHEISPMLAMLPSIASILLWSIALAMLLALSLVYALRCFHHMDKVKAEFLDDVGVNYLFVPSISCLFLLQTSPFDVPKDGLYLQVLCLVCVMPIVMLDIKIYGQWFTKGKRFLSKMANPACQMSVIANLAAAKAAMYMGWAEMALCLFSLGMVHYLVLFVTLYQRLPGSNGVSHMLRPVFFLFFATPSMASLAWSSINGGTFDRFSKMLFFLSVFLFMSLVSRPSLFKKSMKKMTIAWWAYSFPLTLLALASIEYAEAVNHGAARAFAIVLSLVSILASLSLMLLTSLNFSLLFLYTTPASDPN
ncbi:hypothetical protein vseg_005376 [Gypsophila vaccaria]